MYQCIHFLIVVVMVGQKESKKACGFVYVYQNTCFSSYVPMLLLSFGDRLESFIVMAKLFTAIEMGSFFHK